MTLQLALNTQPGTSAAIVQPEPLPSLVSNASDDSAMVDVEADQKTIVVFESCIDGGVRMTVGGVYLVPEDSERELIPHRYIMNNTSGILWKGPSLLPYIFWAHIPEDKNLDVLQQAVCTCLLIAYDSIFTDFSFSSWPAIHARSWDSHAIVCSRYPYAVYAAGISAWAVRSLFTRRSTRFKILTVICSRGTLSVGKYTG